jgi:small subunit ribosomal protein S15
MWCKYKPEEIEALVVKLSREGNSPDMIGVILRDRYAIPLAKPITGKTITQILQSSGVVLKTPEDLESLLKKADGLRKHLEKNREDYISKRALALVESKIHRLVKYYRGLGVLSSDWEYKPLAASVA